jgi:chlorobactene glucosyltransferase
LVLLAATAWFPTTTSAVLAGFLALLSLVWLKRHFDIWRAGQEHLLSEADADCDDTRFPGVSVLVAAKDEEANIEQCARGLLAQDYPHFEVLVINDRSTDGTGKIIDRLAAETSRFRAVHVTELPEGWFGKNNAMRTGVAAARHELLIFSDADCSFDSPQLLRAAVSYARRNGVEFLSVLPRLEAIDWWERVIQPVAGGVMVYWTPPHKVNDPRSSCAYANGAFMLMTRQAYARLGGHEAVKATLNEDMHFARRAKAEGVALRVLRSKEMYRVRMYVGLKQIWRGWSRIFYGCFGTFPKLLASVMMLTFASVMPYVVLVGAMLGGEAWRGVAAAAGLCVLAQQSVLWRYYPLSGIPAPYAMTYPLGAFMCLGITLDAMTRLSGRKTTWRGTAYAKGA